MADILEPALPWDILREIAFICPRGTCTTLMRTCAFFNHEAAASILSQRIRLRMESTAKGFLKFLQAGKKPRYPCVRHLALRFNRHSPLSPETANALAEAIALMTGLVVVEVGFGEYTIGNWPALRDAIAFLPSLRQIFIENAGPRSWQFLLSLQSAKLRSIKIDFFEREPEPEEELSGQRLSAPWLSSHPVQSFGRWTSTLTELAYYCRYAHPTAHDAFSRYSEVYPMMRTLSMCHRGHCLDPTPYIRAFPNLAHLEVNPQSKLDRDQDRTSNTHEVQRLRPVSQHRDAGWRELVQFHGPLVDLYALALNCHISHIKLDTCLQDMDLPLLSVVLADTRPTHLHIFGYDGVLHHPNDSLSSILQTQGASRLESLVVSCLIKNHIPHEDIVSALIDNRLLFCAHWMLLGEEVHGGMMLWIAANLYSTTWNAKTLIVDH
ncbi:hypothetical protein C8Q74DRAFT_1402517 [Fomes fomentarius]|nr:hypothetical protein C8Q74DRAFT_1402517 [Fomes fomentarius]